MQTMSPALTGSLILSYYKSENSPHSEVIIVSKTNGNDLENYKKWKLKVELKPDIYKDKDKLLSKDLKPVCNPNIELWPHKQPFEKSLAIMKIDKAAIKLQCLVFKHEMIQYNQDTI